MRSSRIGTGVAAPKRPRPAPPAPGPARGPADRYPGGDWAQVGEVRRRLSVTLDGSGNGSVQFSVRHANQRWLIGFVTVSTNQPNTQAPYPTATIYEGPQQAGMADGATWTGNQDSFRGRFVMDACTDLTVAFTGGVPGSVATVVIEGTNELRAELAHRRN